jgi:hypothetical protein
VRDAYALTAIEQLGQGGPVHVEGDGDASQGALDLPPDLGAGQRREGGRQIGQDRFEAQPLGQGQLGSTPARAMGHQGDDEQSL